MIFFIMLTICRSAAGAEGDHPLQRNQLTGHACTEAMSGAEEAGS